MIPLNKKYRFLNNLNNNNKSILLSKIDSKDQNKIQDSKKIFSNFLELMLNFNKIRISNRRK